MQDEKQMKKSFARCKTDSTLVSKLNALLKIQNPKTNKSKEKSEERFFMCTSKTR